MNINLTPWKNNERLFFYRQSQQLAGQTGQIGKLRADFGRTGDCFFSFWENIRPDLQTTEFMSEFYGVINALRFETEGTPLGTRKALAGFLRNHPEAILPNDGDWHGFRADTEKYSFFFRLKAQLGDYNVYVWCHRKEWLDDHMAKAKKGIRFIDSGYNEKFTVPDGGKVRILFSDGTSEERICRYIDDTHVQFDNGSGPYGIQHICEFAEKIEKIGATVEPINN